MSGNSFAGRMNMLFWILSKGIVKHNINLYIERCAGPSLYKRYNPVATFLGLFTMLSNNGVIPVEAALKALIDGKTLLFNTAKSILLNADINKIRLALPKLFTTGEFIVYESKMTNKIFAIELPWFQITLWKPVAVFQHRRRTKMEGEVDNLSLEVFKVLASEAGLFIPEGLDLLNPCLDFEGVEMVAGIEPIRTSDSPAAISANDLKVLFGFVRSTVIYKVEQLVSVEKVSEGITLDTPVDVSIKAIDCIDRYQEMLELVKRYEIKIDPDSSPVPAKLVTPSRLKLLRLLMKQGRRPLFTTAQTLLS